MKKINKSNDPKSNDAMNGITRRRFIQYGSLAAASSIMVACTQGASNTATTGGATSSASPAADGKKASKSA